MHFLVFYSYIFILYVYHLWKEAIERPRRKWEDNIKIDLQEVGGGSGDWM
jgi:hypothetical protein